MGAWGTGIFEEDLTSNIRDEFNDMLEQGLTVDEATGHILEDFLGNLEEMSDEQERLAEESLIYIALAHLQLLHEALDEQIRTKAIELIDQGADLSFWEEAANDHYEDRKKIFEGLRAKLVSANK